MSNETDEDPIVVNHTELVQVVGQHQRARLEQWRARSHREWRMDEGLLGRD